MTNYTPNPYNSNYNKPKKKRGCLPAIVLVVILVVVFLITTIGKLLPSIVGDKLQNNFERMEYRYPKDSYETLNEKLQELAAVGDFKEAAIYIEENEWYTITDKQTAEAILSAVQAGRINTKNNGTSTSSDRENVETVLNQLDCPEATALTETLDAFYYDYGMLYINNSREKAYELLEHCSSGSIGNSVYLGFTMLNEGEILEAAKLLSNSPKITQTNRPEIFAAFNEQKLSADRSDHATYLEYEQATGLLFPYADRNPLTENGTNMLDHHEMANDPMDETLRDSLPQQFSKNNHGDILVLSRITDYETDNTTLEVNWILTQILPQDRQPETYADVGYIILLDYGYIQSDEIWYAGTVNATVYDVATEEILYTSETLEAAFKEFYYGEPTDYIFSSYPSAAPVLWESLQALPE